MNKTICLSAALVWATMLPSFGAEPTGADERNDVLRRDNVVAWCIVPFDAKKRTPAERAVMLNELGIRRSAYDWRDEHVPTFEQEILQYRQHGIEFFAFWSVHEDAFKLFEKHDLHPQVWQTLGEPNAVTDEEKIELAAQQFLPLARRTQALGCKLGLYNHGGWGGEPKNLVAVCRRLHELGQEHVGIVYNFHHGHGHITDWAESLELMKPLLLCLNLNGMNADGQPKILGIGKGEHELEMIRQIVESGYDGPIGILDHREELDARESLQENLDGLEWVRKEIKEPGSGGPKPSGPPSASEQPNDADQSGGSPVRGGAIGRLYPGTDAYRRPPLMVECRATIYRDDQYNILVASDTKNSAAHWEIFSMKGNGRLTAYLPGYQPDHVHSEARICDGRPHTISMNYEPERVRLYVDGQKVADQEITFSGKQRVPGALGIGRLVEADLDFAGRIDWVRISNDARQITREPADDLVRDDATVGLWEFAKTDAKKAHAAHHHAADDANDEKRTTKGQTFGAAPYSKERVERLAAEATEHGNAMRGARLFANAKLACLSCHQVGRHGGTVGPDLSEIGKQRELRQIIESVLWPAREIEPKFSVWQILTSDGTIHSGYKEASNHGEMTLRDPATGKAVRIAADDVEAEVPGNTLMPSGLTAAISTQEEADLIRFLSELGRGGSAFAEEIDALLAHAQMHGPATFPLDRSPVVPENWPHAKHPVNRDRLYDFYTKQAEYFRQQNGVPMLLASFPGIDGAETGHWGNQSEEDWADDRWNETVLGSIQAGIFHADGITVPRGVCVRLGDQGELSVCFNPDTLTYDAAWSGGFVTFSGVRHGFLHGLQMEGRLLPRPESRKPDEPFTYRGFYRHGKRVVFSYRIGDVEFLDAPWVEDGRFVREVAPAEHHSLRAVTEGGPAQWPQILETEIVPGDGRPFAIDTIGLPHQNPWKALLFCGGHDFLPDGNALVCTMQGDVWHVSGFDAPAGQPATALWRRFASGLHHPLGLAVSDHGAVYVQCRDQLTRLTDANGDGEADFYECFSNAFETSPAGHDFICGLQRDAQGNFYMASGNQGLVRISADGKRADVLATGFRNPDGLGLLPDGTLTVPCSEGDWTAASMICAIPDAANRPTDDPASGAPPHFGYQGPRDGQTPELPLVYLPRGIDNSSGGQAFVDSEVWKPLQGQLVHFSFGMGSWFVVLRDEVDGQPQGAVVPMAGDFLSGVHRGRFHPQDGQLYVTGMSGWGSYTPDDGCFQRVRYTGDPLQVPTGFHVHENGVRITFTKPIDAAIAENVKSHFAQCWNYRYSGAYGSPEYSTTHPGVQGHDPLTITSAHVLPDGRSLFLEIPSLQPVSQLHLRLHVNEGSTYRSPAPTGDGHDLFVTVHALDRPFSDFPGYRPLEKTIAAHPLLADLAFDAVRTPNPWRQPLDEARPVEIETGKNLTYATPEFEVTANETIALTLTNPDVVPHNWVLARPGSLRRVGELANQLIADPKAFARQYVPESDDVLVYTDVVPPGENHTVYFRAPETPGRYPFLCTFPGHWMVMNGVMVVQ